MIAFAFLCALHEIGQGQTDTACQRAGNDKGFDRLGVAADEVAFQQVTHGLCEGHTRQKRHDAADDDGADMRRGEVRLNEAGKACCRNTTQKRPEEIGDFLFAKPDIQTAR